MAFRTPTPRNSIDLQCGHCVANIITRLLHQAIAACGESPIGALTAVSGSTRPDQTAAPFLLASRTLLQGSAFWRNRSTNFLPRLTSPGFDL